MTTTTIADAAAAIRRGDLTCEALARQCIARAEALDSRLGAYVHRTDALAIEAGAWADAELAAGRDRGPLHGIPLCVKDVFATADAPTSLQTQAVDQGWGAGADAVVVRRLREAGAVLTGKTTTMELAIGIPDPDQPFPIPRNPWSPDRWAGGSSSGTAVAIATGMALGGPGSDTGGSIRIPSAFCGTSGLKPTFGRISSRGCHPLAPTLDHVGPMARTAYDCGLLLDAFDGHDPDDALSASVPFDPVIEGIDDGISGMRVGVDPTLMSTPGIDDEVRGAFESALTSIAACGGRIVHIRIPGWNEGVAAATVSMWVESYKTHKSNLESRWSDFGRPTRQMLALGALVPGAAYAQAQRVRQALRRDLHALFSSVDVVATMAAGAGAPPVDGLGLLSAFTMPLFLSYWNGVGLPALVVPAGFDRSGLPIGLQLASRAWDERTVLRVGHCFQTITDWHRQEPALIGADTIEGAST